MKASCNLVAMRSSLHTYFNIILMTSSEISAIFFFKRERESKRSHTHAESRGAEGERETETLKEGSTASADPVVQCGAHHMILRS